jgi:hypothetical protein
MYSPDERAWLEVVAGIDRALELDPSPQTRGALLRHRKLIAALAGVRPLAGARPVAHGEPADVVPIRREG